MSRRRIGAAAAVVVVLFALSPAVQGYHVGASRFDTTCVTRLLIQFCKNNRAAEARKAAAAEARTAKEQAAEAAKECRAIAKEAEEAKRTLLGPENYYWSCLRPGTRQALIRKWEVEREQAERGESG